MAWWITFSDRSTGCVEIEHEAGRSYEDTIVAVGCKAHELKPELHVDRVQQLPYPAYPRLNRVGSTPTFCLHGAKCAGRSSCPRNYACSE